MRHVRLATVLMLALMLAPTLAVVGAAGARAEKLDKSVCNELKAELAGMLADRVRAGMVHGPQWAKDNLPPEKLRDIKRLIEIEEQLEFRCGMRYAKIMELPPAKAPGERIPAGPMKKPEELGAIAGSGAEEPPAKAAAEKEAVAKQTEKKAPAKKAETKKSAIKKAAAAPSSSGSPAKPSRQSASSYVSPRDVNPYSLSRYGDSSR